MFAAIIRNKLSLLENWRALTNCRPNHLHGVSCALYVSRSFSSKENSIEESPGSSFSTSHRHGNPDKTDSVLTFFRGQGFSEIQIANVIKKKPNLLLSNPEKTFLPKLEFFYSKGLSRADVAEFLSSRPDLLLRSLKNQLVPWFDYLEGILPPGKKGFPVLKRGLFFKMQKDVVPNVALLREIGVPELHITTLVNHNPSVMTNKHNRFKKMVESVTEMGLNPLKSVFIHAVRVLIETNSPTLKRKMHIYGSYGLSDTQIQEAFRRYPLCMKLSEKKIISKMDFLIEKMGHPPVAVMKTPRILSHSLEKRIIPRCRVLKGLLSKGLIKKEFCLSTIVSPSDKLFLHRFVTKYLEHIPELASIFKRETTEKGFGCKKDIR